MAHNKNLKNFDAISKHLEMEEERKKLLIPPNVALVAKGSKPKGKKALSCQTGQERSMCPPKLPT